MASISDTLIEVTKALKLYTALQEAGMTSHMHDSIVGSSQLASGIVQYVHSITIDGQSPERALTLDNESNLHAPLSSIEMTGSLRNITKRLCLSTLAQLALLSEAEFLAVRAVGPQRVQEAKMVLARVDAEFRPAGVKFWDAVSRTYPELGKAPAVVMTYASGYVDIPPGLQELFDQATVEQLTTLSTKDIEGSEGQASYHRGKLARTITANLQRFGLSLRDN